MSANPLRVVWLQSPPWKGVWTRQNHFARRIVRDGGEVLYVENPPALGSRLREESIRPFNSTPESYEAEPGIHILKLPLQLPGGNRHEMIGRLNGWRFAKSISSWLNQAGWSDYIVWCRLPNSLHALSHLSPRFTVYDVTDDYELYAKNERERAITKQLEAKLARRADQIFTTTTALADKLRTINQNVRNIPNGVDKVFFDIPTKENTPLRDISSPRIGYIGIVASWMDFDLLEKLGQRWPGHIVIIGPVKPEVKTRFHAIPGIIHIDHIPHLDVPRYLAAFDLCILPHQLTELRHRADPLKLVEYLASGKPIVTVSLRSAIPYQDLMDLADDHDSFLASVAKHLEAPHAELPDARRTAARLRDWDHLYEQVRQCLPES